jgi:hypothetical protein
MAGGILWLIIFFLVAIFALQNYYRKKRAASSAAVQLDDIRPATVEAVPDTAPYGAAISKPSYSSSATLPNSEGT